MSDKYYIEDHNGVVHRVSKLNENDRVVKCVICGRPAVSIDHLHPDERLFDRCHDHLKSLVDLEKYERDGIGVEICKMHYDMNDILYRLREMSDFLESQEDDESKLLNVSFRFAVSQIEKYIPNKWPDEVSK